MQQPTETILHDGNVADTAHIQPTHSTRLGMVMMKSEAGADGKVSGEVAALAGTGARAAGAVRRNLARRGFDAFPTGNFHCHYPRPRSVILAMPHLP
jgi:hypothetical protein